MTRLRGPLGLLGCLVLALVLAAVTPDPGTDLRRRWTGVEVGGWARTPGVSARVGSVTVTRSAAREYGDPFVSRQALVVLSVDAQVRQRVAQLSEVRLRTRDGHGYDPRPEFAAAGLGQTQPGFTRHSTLVFEVPADRLAGSTLEVDADGASIDGYARAIRVELGLRDPVPIGAAVASVPPATVTTT
jgi:hypothetical protein